jgi:hypothetical protein
MRDRNVVVISMDAAAVESALGMVCADAIVMDVSTAVIMLRNLFTTKTPANFI